MFAWVIKILQYERIDVLEGFDLDKTDKSKECEVCNYNYFNNGFRSYSIVPNDCNSGITAFVLENFAVINIKGVGYRIFMSDMTEYKVHNILGDFESGIL